MEYSNYISLVKNGEIFNRISKLEKLYSPICLLCPVRCNSKRIEGEKGYCGVNDELIISSWNLHFGEEPPISGKKGSGTIFLPVVV